MMNMYFEKVSENKAETEEKLFAYFINTDIEDNGVVNISTFVQDKHFLFQELVDNFRIMLNAVKSYSIYNSIGVLTSDKDSSLLIDWAEHTISVEILNPDFDVEDIVSQFTYAVGYLQCGMINEFDEQEEE